MPLNQKQIDTLFKFTLYNGVEYYDLQVELVDHLASGIEEELAKDITLTPYDALQKVYAGFGKKGFQKIISEKEDALRKENTKIWLRLAKQYLTIPKIAFTSFLFVSLYYLSGFFSSMFRATAVELFFVLCLFGQSFYIAYLWKGCKKKLLLASYNSVFQLTGFFVPYFILMTAKNTVHNEIYFATIITIYSVLTIAALQLNQKLKKKAIGMYPGAFVNA